MEDTFVYNPSNPIGECAVFNNRLVVLLAGIPLIIGAVLFLIRFVWDHFPIVQEVVRKLEVLLVARRPQHKAADASKLPVVRVRQPHTTKTKTQKMSKVRPWIKKLQDKVPDSAKKRVKRITIIAGITLATTAVLSGLIWVLVRFEVFGAISENAPTVRTGTIVGMLTKIFIGVACIAATAGIIALVRHNKDKIKDAGKGAIKLVAKIKEGLKFLALTIVWAAIVLTFYFLSLKNEMAAPWNFLWKLHMATTIATGALLLLWSFLKYFAEKAKPIEWGAKAVAILILSLWVHAFWMTDTVQGYRAKRERVAAQEHKEAEVRRVSSQASGAFIVPPFTVTKDSWSDWVEIKVRNFDYSFTAPVEARVMFEGEIRTVIVDRGGVSLYPAEKLSFRAIDKDSTGTLTRR